MPSIDGVRLEKSVRVSSPSNLAVLKNPYPGFEIEGEALDETAKERLLAKRMDDALKGNLTGGQIDPNDEFGLDYGDLPIQLLFVHGSNPVHHTHSPRKSLQWMKQIPLTVCISTIWNETAEASTLLLPEHHFLERWQDVSNPNVVSTSVVGLSQPVAEKPMHDTKHFLGILSGIASKMDGPFNKEISIPSSEEKIKDYFEGLLKFRADSWKSRPSQACENYGQGKHLKNVRFMRLLTTARR